MGYGSIVPDASWLTMLPGSLLAGTGLSLTNTPVTNTTTGAVTPDRAGMASGIDMSARLITLAVNITLMGFILVEGIYAYLENALRGTVGPLQLHTAAEKIAAGLSTTDVPGAIGHAALVQGFSWVMLFGGIGICALALVSFLIFGPKEKAVGQVAV